MIKDGYILARATFVSLKIVLRHFYVGLLVTIVGWYRTKRPMHCGQFLIYCASPSEF